MLNQSLLEYKGGSPLEYGQLKGWSQDIGSWTEGMKHEFVKWSNNMPEGGAPIGGYRPPGLKYGGPGEAPGFGPGPYQGGYDGAGDSVFWGNRDQQDISAKWADPEGQQMVDEVLEDFENNVNINEGGYWAGEWEDIPSIGYDGETVASMSGTDGTMGGQPPSIGETVPSMSEGTDGTMGQPMEFGDTPMGDELSFSDSALSRWGDEEFALPTNDLLLETVQLGDGTTVGNVRPFVTKGELDSLPDVPNIDHNLFANMSESELSVTSRVFSENSLGVAANGNGFFSWNNISGQLIRLLPGIVLAPLIGWIGTLGEEGKQASDIIQMAAVGMALLNLDPIGAALGTVGLLAQKYAEQQQNIAENNWGEDISDKFFGYVEDQGVWYPAVLRKRIKGEGLIDDSNEFTWVYGRPEDFYLAQDADGKIRGHFANFKEREFRVTNHQWSSRKDMASVNKHDPLRQWMVMNPEDTQKMLLSYGTDDFSWEMFDRDTSDFTPYMKKNTEFAKALDLIKNYTQMTDDPSAATLSASKSFRYNFNKAMDQAAGFNEHPDPRTGVDGLLPKADRKFGYGTYFDGNLGIAERGFAEWFNVIDEILPHQMEALFQTRQLASMEQEVSEKMYNDYAKDLPAAKDYSELKAQLDLIQGYDDRTKTQKFYLQNKAATRYMMQAASDMGYGNQIWESLHETSWKKAHFMSSSAYKYKDIPDVPAWINRGESGIPEFIQLSNYRRGREDKSPAVYEKFMADLEDRIDQDVDKKLEEQGIKFKQKFHEATPSREEFAAGVGTIPYNNIIKTGKRHWNAYWSKKIRRMRKKQIMVDRIRSYRIREVRDEGDPDLSHMEQFELQDHPLDDMGKEITYERFLGWVNDQYDSPEFHLGEPSLVHVYESLLKGVYSWAPRNVSINETNLPDDYIKGHEEPFKNMLANLDPKYRQRADRLHNQVYAKSTEDYMQRYHSADPSKVDVARDAAGTTEIFNDWALPYQKNLKQVKFNNHIHTQMDFSAESV